MPIREFVDSRGVAWTVWEVIASSTDRRRLFDRRLVQRGARDRRRTRLSASEGTADGWLTFESRSEKRRLRPIPPQWYVRDDRGLEALLESASPVPRSRRLIE